MMDTSPHTSDFVTVNGIRLHYLDWGGPGPALLFLTGMGLSAHIYDHFAPRFSDKFRVLALTRRGHGDSDYPETGYDVDTLTEDVRGFMDALKIERAILVGHSMANVELCHMAATHPERLLKLVFLDAAYDRTTRAFKDMHGKNPARVIPIPGVDDPHYSIEDYAAAVRRNYPSLAAIWGELMDEDLRHAVRQEPDGRVVDRQSEAIGAALNDTLAGYASEDAHIQVPVLSIYAVNCGEDYISPDYMTAEQQAAVLNFYEHLRPGLQMELLEIFRRRVPHARIVVLPHSHHYCFIKDEPRVFEEMMKFLLAE